MISIIDDDNSALAMVLFSKLGNPNILYIGYVPFGDVWCLHVVVLVYLFIFVKYNSL